MLVPGQKAPLHALEKRPAGYVGQIDRDVLNFFVHHRQPWLTTVARAVTALGGSAVLIPMVVVVGLVYRRARRSWAPLVLLALSYLGGEALFQVLKLAIGRPRPPVALAVGHYSGYAFPSGHATLSAAVWGMGATLVAGTARRTWAAVTVWAGAALTVGLVGATRLYLGAHWLSDVLAGWVLGAAWLAALVSTVSRRWPGFRSGSSSPGAGPEPGPESAAASTVSPGPRSGAAPSIHGPPP